MSFQFLADFDHDGSFSYDISAYIKQFDLRNGAKNPYQLMADGNQLKLTLDNRDGRFYPENSSSPYYPNIKAHRRIKAQWGSAAAGTTVLFVGWIKPQGIDAPWKAAGDSIDKQDVGIVCVGPKLILDRAVIDIAPFGETTVDLPIKAILRSARATLAVNNEWILGHATYSVLGATTYLTQIADLDTGTVTIPSYADLDSGKAWRSIEELVMAEQGHFGVARDGRPYLWNRHYVMGTATPAGTVVTDTGSYRTRDVDYQVGATYVNSPRVRSSPRKADTSTQTLWTMNDASISIPAGDDLVLEADLKTAEGRIVGVSTDLAISATFLGGVECETSVNRKGGRAQIVLDNSEGDDDVTITALTLTGTPVLDQDTFQYEIRDEAVVAEFGLQTVTIDAGPIADIDGAKYIAEWIVYDRVHRGEVLDVSWSMDYKGTAEPFPISWPLGTLLRVEVPSRSHAANYWVVGEHWRWNVKRTLDVSHFLEPANQTAWALGVAGRSEPNTIYMGY